MYYSHMVRVLEGIDSIVPTYTADKLISFCHIGRGRLAALTCSWEWATFAVPAQRAERRVNMSDKATPSFAIFDDYRPTVSFAVLVRWVLLAAWFFVLHYKIEYDQTILILNVMALGLAALNAYVTWRIIARRPITWHYASTLSVADLIVITTSLFLAGGLQNPHYVFYYPALLGLALMSPWRVAIAVGSVVIALYVLMAFTVSPTVIWDMEQEKWLVTRSLTMLGIVVAGTLITGWERSRRLEAVAAERQRSEENLKLQRKAQQAELAAVEERSRIAREIHDGIAQSIYMLSLHLETSADLARQHREDLEERLDGLVNLSKETLLEVRHYIFDLKPYLAGEKGLASMVENQVREFNNIAGVPTRLETEGEERPVAVATCVYRVTQEALANAFKHAMASGVDMLLGFGPGEVKLSVRDDGRGFDLVNANHGHGLTNMRERVEELGGKFSLLTAPGEGTQVVIHLPC